MNEEQAALVEEQVRHALDLMSLAALLRTFLGG